MLLHKLDDSVPQSEMKDPLKFGKSRAGNGETASVVCCPTGGDRKWQGRPSSSSLPTPAADNDEDGNREGGKGSLPPPLTTCDVRIS